MAIPAGTIGHPSALLDLMPDDDVLEDLVDGMTDMQRPVRIRRPIVEHKLIVFGAVRSLPGVEVIGALLDVVRQLGRIWAGAGKQLATTSSEPGETYAKVEVGSLNVDFHDLDIVVDRPCQTCSRMSKI